MSTASDLTARSEGQLSAESKAAAVGSAEDNDVDVIIRGGGATKDSLSQPSVTSISLPTSFEKYAAYFTVAGNLTFDVTTAIAIYLDEWTPNELLSYVRLFSSFTKRVDDTLLFSFIMKQIGRPVLNLKRYPHGLLPTDNPIFIYGDDETGYYPLMLRENVTADQVIADNLASTTAVLKHKIWYGFRKHALILLCCWVVFLPVFSIVLWSDGDLKERSAWVDLSIFLRISFSTLLYHPLRMPYFICYSSKLARKLRGIRRQVFSYFDDFAKPLDAELLLSPATIQASYSHAHKFANWCFLIPGIAVLFLQLFDEFFAKGRQAKFTVFFLQLLLVSFGAIASSILTVTRRGVRGNAKLRLERLIARNITTRENYRLLRENLVRVQGFNIDDKYHHKALLHGRKLRGEDQEFEAFIQKATDVTEMGCCSRCCLWVLAWAMLLLSMYVSIELYSGDGSYSYPDIWLNITTNATENLTDTFEWVDDIALNTTFTTNFTEAVNDTLSNMTDSVMVAPVVANVTTVFIPGFESEEINIDQLKSLAAFCTVVFATIIRSLRANFDGETADFADEYRKLLFAINVWKANLAANEVTLPSSKKNSLSGLFRRKPELGFSPESVAMTDASVLSGETKSPEPFL